MNRTITADNSLSPKVILGLASALTFLALLLSGIAAPAEAGRTVPQEATPAQLLEIRYTNPAASEVMLVWGINGWQSTSLEGQPEGTVVNKGVMNTPMTLENGVFVVRIKLPAWAEVDYGFLTTKDQNGDPVQAWEDNGGKDFQTTMAAKDMVVEAGSGPVTGANEGGESAGPMVNLDIRYISPAAGEVYLVWGINGWGLAPESQWPSGTVVQQNTLHTPMHREGQTYVSRLRVPAGTTLDFGFLTTQDSQGKAVNIWEADGGQDYQITPTRDQTLEIQAQAGPGSGRNVPRWLVVGLYVLIGLIVVLVVAFVFGRRSA